MRRLLIIGVLCFPILLQAQIFEGDEYDYTSEIVWGVNKNTNGGLIGGLMFRLSRSVGETLFASYGLELSNVKHPSEVRYLVANGAAFTYGKSNHLYAIRLQYGREKLLFKKASQQGVQISVLGTVGPTIGLESPYYLNTGDGNYAPFEPINSQSPNTYPPPQAYFGPGRLFQGLGESQVVPGLNTKVSAIFEFGTYKSNVAGLEVGYMLEAFTRKIIIMPTRPNDSAYSSVFITLFWGTRK